jgi:tetratricopeptide (TPR) repeat protein
MPIPEEVRKKVFVSYSHTDSEWLKRVQTHLKDLTRRGMVDLWDDTKIQSGSQWREEIRGALESAKVAVLLISADFIASDFIAEDELPPLLAAAEKDGVKILSLILSPSRYEKIESLSKYQSINPPSKPLIGLPKVEQEAYLVKLSDDVLRAAEEAQTTPAGASGAVRSRIFNLPFSRNKFFTGRDDILKGIHKNFSEGENVQALSGIGGVGKTQTALQYAYQYQQAYRIVLWGNANSRETLVTDFVAMAGLLNLPEKEAQDQSEAVNAVKRWFGNNDGWLLILDNADELVMAREFIPSSETGRILLTTRAQNTKPIAARQAVEKMEPQEGALFLLLRLEEIKKDEQLESAPEGLRKQAEALSKAVDGLPLALDQAAAFIEETPSTLEEYQRLYQSERKELLSRRGKLAEDHPSVTVTFSLAFKKVVDDNPAAADLLRVCAFLEADSIPEEIFSEGAKELGEALGSAAESPLALTDAIGEAARFSLLRRHPEARTVSLHRLAQAVLRDEMDSDTRRMWAERAVRALDGVFPSAKYSTWYLCDRLIPHAQLLASLIDEYGFDFPEAARLMNRAGYYLKERAQYAEAEPLYQRALDIREKTLGPEHPDTATSLNNLAGLYNSQGRYAEAEPLYQRALDITEKALGPEHPYTAMSLNNLAGLYDSQGRYAEAEPLLKRALDITEKALGPEHPSTITVLKNYAALLRKVSHEDEADELEARGGA